MWLMCGTEKSYEIQVLKAVSIVCWCYGRDNRGRKGGAGWIDELS